MHMVPDDHPSLRGIAFVTEGVWDLVESTIKGAKTKKWYNYALRSEFWNGRRFESWDDLMTVMKTPDPKTVEEISLIMDEFRTEIREMPITIKRKRHWNKSVGNVSVPRAIGGNPNFMCRYNRQKHTGPKNIVLVYNMDATYDMRPESMRWSGIAMAAAVDLLEDAGYLCELWVTKAGKVTFYGNHPNSFVSARVKGASDTLDLDLLGKVFSPWFLRLAMFGIRLNCPPNVDKGQLAGVWYGYPDLWETRYMDATTGVYKTRVTSTRDRTAAINMVTSLIRKMNESKSAEAD